MTRVSTTCWGGHHPQCSGRDCVCNCHSRPRGTIRDDVEDLMLRWSADMVPTKGDAVTPRTFTTAEAAGQLQAILNDTYARLRQPFVTTDYTGNHYKVVIEGNLPTDTDGYPGRLVALGREGDIPR